MDGGPDIAEAPLPHYRPEGSAQDRIAAQTDRCDNHPAQQFSSPDEALRRYAYPSIAVGKAAAGRTLVTTPTQNLKVPQRRFPSSVIGFVAQVIGLQRIAPATFAAAADAAMPVAPQRSRPDALPFGAGQIAVVAPPPRPLFLSTTLLKSVNL